MSEPTDKFQRFLDNQQFTLKGIKKYEKIFGETYVSPGAEEASKEMASYLDLKPGQKCLDVGCGLGGNAFYLAKNFDVYVQGIDLSTNMIRLAREYACGRYKDNRVSLDVADVTTYDLDENSLDVIYSVGVIVHVEDKVNLFRRFLKWLKPGGKLFIKDYICSDGDHSQEFKAYIACREYHILTFDKYTETLRNAGFDHVTAEDKAEYLTEVSQKELARLESSGKQGFLEEFSEEDYRQSVKAWTGKIERSRQGEQSWGLFFATK